LIGLRAFEESEAKMLEKINFPNLIVLQTTANVSIPPETDVVTVDATAGPRTVTLPSPSVRSGSGGPSPLGEIRILKTDGSANVVTISTQDGAIVGKTSLSSQNASATCVPSGTGQWFIF